MKSKEPDVHISVVIPAYNEASRIITTITAIEKYLDETNQPHELIIVDDGSIDGTFVLLNNLKQSITYLKVISLDRNHGKGCAVRTGILASTGNFILMSDADLSTPIEELEKLILEIQNGYDIAIGSRALRGSEVIVKQPLYREILGKMFNIFIRSFVLKGFRDTQCGFKLFKGDIARSLFSQSVIDGFSFDVEILVLAQKNGFRIAEVPVKWANNMGSKVSVIRHPLSILKELFMIRKRHKHAQKI